jgi:AcrR family transcriptional regulator
VRRWPSTSPRSDHGWQTEAVTTTRAPDDISPVDEVVAAARRCFARYGVTRATMEDIAAEAGIGRTGVYRLGLSRREINDAAILARLREGTEQLGPLMGRELDFEDLLVEGAAAAIEWAREDEELQNLLGKTRTVALHRLLTGPAAIMHDLIYSVNNAAFERARAAGQMREDIDDHEAVDWIQGVYLVLLLRDDLSPAQTRAKLREFLVPAFSTVAYQAQLRAR